MPLLSIVLMLMIGFTGCSNSAPSKDKKEVAKKVTKQTAQPVKSTQTEKQSTTAETKDKKTEQNSSSSFQPFTVYVDKGARENHYIPSGFMPNGKCISFDDAWGENCHSGKTCIHVKYDVVCSRADQKWAGVYWLNPANNWGQKKGGFNLTGAQKLVFWAKGEKGGEQIQEITVGGITGDYPDTDTAVIGPIILTNQWQEYTIDLRGKDLSNISGGFSWTSSEEVNQDECNFYLDDIRYE
jgi:hypothetical protein